MSSLDDWEMLLASSLDDLVILASSLDDLSSLDKGEPPLALWLDKRGLPLVLLLNGRELLVVSALDERELLVASSLVVSASTAVLLVSCSPAAWVVLE